MAKTVEHVLKSIERNMNRKLGGNKGEQKAAPKNGDDRKPDTGENAGNAMTPTPKYEPPTSWERNLFTDKFSTLYVPAEIILNGEKDIVKPKVEVTGFYANGNIKNSTLKIEYEAISSLKTWVNKIATDKNHEIVVAWFLDIPKKVIWRFISHPKVDNVTDIFYSHTLVKSEFLKPEYIYEVAKNSLKDTTSTPNGEAPKDGPKNTTSTPNDKKSQENDDEKRQENDDEKRVVSIDTIPIPNEALIAFKKTDLAYLDMEKLSKPLVNCTIYFNSRKSHYNLSNVIGNGSGYKITKTTKLPTTHEFIESAEKRHKKSIESAEKKRKRQEKWKIIMTKAKKGAEKILPYSKLTAADASATAGLYIAGYTTLNQIPAIGKYAPTIPSNIPFVGGVEVPTYVAGVAAAILGAYGMKKIRNGAERKRKTKQEWQN